MTRPPYFLRFRIRRHPVVGASVGSGGKPQLVDRPELVNSFSGTADEAEFQPAERQATRMPSTFRSVFSSDEL